MREGKTDESSKGHSTDVTLTQLFRGQDNKGGEDGGRKLEAFRETAGNAPVLLGMGMDAALGRRSSPLKTDSGLSSIALKRMLHQES